jgi:hypothetical protein
MRKLVFALFVVLVLWKAAALAQGSTAELYGVIKDPSGNMISGATVKVQNTRNRLTAHSHNQGGRDLYVLRIKAG